MAVCFCLIIKKKPQISSHDYLIRLIEKKNYVL